MDRDRPELRPLRIALRSAISGLEVNGCLYLPSDGNWGLDTPGLILNLDELSEQDIGADGEPLVAIEQELTSILDSPTIEQIVASTFHFNVPITDELLFESFMYYHKSGNFLPEPGAYARQEAIYRARLLQMERSFYDDLGEERQDVQCEKKGCTRGALSMRIYCKIHHYEMMKKKPCPFSD